MSVETREPFDCASFITAARAKGIVLSPKDEQIDVWGPAETLADDFVATLAANKRAILAYLGGTAARPPETVEAGTASSREPFPLTDIQRAYWVGRQQAFELGGVSIHFYTEVDCADLDPPRLQAAWDRTVDQHPMLCAVVDGNGMQRVLEPVERYLIEWVDLSGVAEAERSQRLAALRAELSHKVRRSDAWPAFDIVVARTGDRTARLFFGLDLLHIDGGSLLLVLDHFSTWYRDPGLERPRPALTFRDVVEAEIAAKETPAYAEDVRYWEGVVADLPPPPQLPEHHPDRAQACFTRRTFRLTAAERGPLKAIAAAAGITPTSLLVTLFSQVIQHWNGAEDFTLNVTLFNRPAIHPDIGHLAGDFTSMVPLAIRQRPGATLAEEATALQGALWRHLEHRRVSGVEILAALRRAQASQDAARLTVVFTSLLNLEESGFPPTWLSPLGREVFTVTQTPQVTLDHQVFDTCDGGMAFSWDTVDTVFPERLIDVMFGVYEALIRRVVEAGPAALRWPRRPLTPPDQIAVFDAANATAVTFPEGETLVSLFRDAVEAHGTRLAVVSGDVEISYRALARASEHLATMLARHGVEHGDCVLLFMQKGWEQPLAALAAHAAGAAFVPVDPASPRERVIHIVADCAPKLVLLDPASADAWMEDIDLPSLVVDPGVLDGETAAPPGAPRARPADVSHIIYTSGSTGRPKGVVIEHRNVVNRIRDINARFAIGPEDAILGLTALHHDLSIYDVFGVLAAGGALVLPEEAERLDPAHWSDLIETRGITLWNSVPFFAGMLVEHVEQEPSRAERLPLRWMILAGDWIPPNLPARVRALWPTIDFIASGGPTETTIWDIWNRVGDVDPDATSIPYGKPLANTSYHVLDAHGRRCPMWVRGELYIGGAGVTRAYLNAAELTAERYLDIPALGGRLFRSGDTGRYLPGGQIEFMGRRDFQVKINGQRIELPEIEKVALDHEGVREAVALVREEAKGPCLTLVVAGRHPGPAPDAAIEEEAEELGRRGVAVSDPAQRLAQKLEYRSLQMPVDARAIELPGVAFDLPDVKSHRTFRRGTMPVAKLAAFLAPLRAVVDATTGQAKFRYGSGGGVYPVQVFLYLRQGAVAELGEGIYRYHPLEHALCHLAVRSIPDDIHWPHNRKTVAGAPIQMFLVGDLSVIEAQYGRHATSMAYIEAGMMAQALREAATTTGFGICQIGDLAFARVQDAFQLGEGQTLLSSLVAGALDDEATSTGARNVPLAESLRRHLAAHLPPSMIPRHVIVLPTLPVTANGKVDRKALMTMERDASLDARRRLEPAAGFETEVAKVLGGLLGVEEVSANANFFDLGANSALLVRAHGLIAKATGTAFPLIDMFRFPTIRSLAEALASPKPEAGGAFQDTGAERAARQRERLAAARRRFRS